MSYSLFGYKTLEKPNNVEELIYKAKKLYGKTLGEMASLYGLEVPKNLKGNKGWIGNLLELVLGADVGSKAEQDFYQFNVELKTVSLSDKFKPVNDTFISMVPLRGHQFQNWNNSHVAYKLQNVLFIFIQTNKDIPLIERKILFSYFWTPTQEHLSLLENDWNNIMDIISFGDYSILNSNIGDVISVKIKGRNKKDSITSYDQDGNLIKLPPLAFYLKKKFISKLINEIVN